VRLAGQAGGKLFRKGTGPVEIPPGQLIDGLGVVRESGRG